MSVYVALLLKVVVKASIVVLLLLLARGCAWLFNMFLLCPPFDPLKNLPGPDGSALQNHFREIMEYVILNTMDLASVFSTRNLSVRRSVRIHTTNGRKLMAQLLDFMDSAGSVCFANNIQASKAYLSTLIA
jgi:hypothetical protein